MNKRVAIIDMGTNTFHLLIADSEDGKSKIIYQDRLVTKIGMGGINEGIITETGIDRAMTALKTFKKIIDQHHVDRISAFGTSAIRNAKNGPDIIRQIKELGIDARIISGDEEAQLIYYGVRSAMNPGMDKSLIMDIGGGSVEFIIADQKEIFWKQSLDIGAQRLLEKFHTHDPLLQSEIEKLDAYFEEVLKPVFNELQKHNTQTLVGSSGTFDTLSDIYCLDQHISKQFTDPEIPLTLDAFYKIYQQLIISSRAERMLVPGMIEMRVDMIVVACCLIRYII
ncbi:MAG TPA: exopolyphosphatase, partial [Cyclobacteriaceae bacterium]